MGLFKRNDEPEFQGSSWQELGEKELQERVSYLIAYLASSLEGTQGMIVSPGSQESKKFMREANEAIKKLMLSPPTTSQLELSRQAYTESAKEFGVWQRDQVSSFQKDTSQALHSLISCARSSMDDQGDTLHEVNMIGSRLKEAEESGDINKLREVVRYEAEKARQIFESRNRDHINLQDDFDESIRELEQKLKAVEGAGSKDYLTECASRAALDFYLSAICRKAQIEKKLYSVAMLDMDDFKGINDLWGHQIGDRALSYLVQSLKKEFPTRAFIGRYGGDEFVVVATMSAEDLEQRLSKLIKRLRKTKVPVRTADSYLTLSLSAGVVEIKPGEEADTVIRRADESLYEAKKQGKGRVMRYKRRAA